MLKPTTKRAALLIAYDNGFINRLCSEQAWLEMAEEALIEYQPTTLDAVETILSKLSKEDLETVCTGKYDEQRKALKSICGVNEHDIRTIDVLLGDIFDA